MRRILLIALILLLNFSLPAHNSLAQEEADVIVRAVLFYSPTCGHCHYVITEVLTPMAEKYDQSLQIMAVDVTQAGGQMLYQAAIDQFKIADNRLGVPTLIVGQVVLVGSDEIPELFPTMVEDGLADAGIDWPEIPELEQALAGASQGAEASDVSAATEATADVEEPTAGAQSTDAETTTGASQSEATNFVEQNQPVATPGGETTPPEAAPDAATSAASESKTRPFIADVESGELPLETVSETVPADPVGFAIATVVLIAMLAILAFVAWRLISHRYRLASLGFSAGTSSISWLVPVVALLGMVVAGYLTYVEMAQVQAVCGPVGHCNIVQSSSYARIFGIPVAVLGLLTYLAIGLLWVVQRDKPGFIGTWLVPALITLSLVATLFSVYLTALELFVIKAVCAWCLTSAVLTTLIMLLIILEVTVETSHPGTKPPPAATRAI